MHKRLQRNEASFCDDGKVFPPSPTLNKCSGYQVFTLVKMNDLGYFVIFIEKAYKKSLVNCGKRLPYTVIIFVRRK